MSRRPIWRWVKRFTLTLLALIAVAVAGTLIVLHTDWGRDRMRRAIEAELREAFPGGATIGRVEGSVLGELTVHDLELAAIDGAPLASVKTLKIEVALLPLVSKIVQVDRLVIEDVELVLPRQVREPRPVASEPASPRTTSIVVRDLEIRRARVVFDGAAEPVTLDDVELDGRLALLAGRPIAITAQVRGRWREREAPIEAAGTIWVGRNLVVPFATADVGGVRIDGTMLAIDPARPELATGTVEVSAPAAAIRALAPEVELPADARAVVIASRQGAEARLEVFGSLGGASLRSTLHVEPATSTARGVVVITGADLGELAPGTLPGHGEARIFVTADRQRARGTVIARATVDEAPPAHAIIGFDATTERIRALVLAAGSGEASVAGTVDLRRVGDRLEIVEPAHLVATVRDASTATGGRVPLTGSVRLGGTARGTIAPELDLALDGSVGGTRLRYDKLGVARLRATLAGRLTRDGVAGRARADLGGVTQAGAPVGSVVVRAHSRADGRIVANVHARHAEADLVVDADAVVTPPRTPADTIEIALGGHRIRAPRGMTWSGRGGAVTVTDRLVTIQRLRSTSGGSRIEVAGSYERQTGSIAAKVDARAIAAVLIDPTYRGTASGTMEVSRTGARWAGGATLTARRLVLGTDAPPIDGDIEVEIAGRRVTVDASATTARVGAVHLVLDVDGPRDVTDLVAWRRLQRKAVRSATLGLTRIDLGAAAPRIGGTVDGELHLAGADTRGTFTVRGVRSPLGIVDGDITFAPLDRSELGAATTARIAGVGDANVAARIAFPLHPFDPRAWQQLGRGVMRELTVSLDDIAIDPARLAALGVDVPYRGRADLAVAIAAGDGIAHATLELHGAEGGSLVKPVDARIKAIVDRNGTTAVARVRTTRPGGDPDAWPDEAAPAPPQHLVRLDASSPITFDRWLDAPEAAIHAPVRGTLQLPERAVAEWLALVGRSEVTSGTVRGEVAIAGTIGTPTGTGTFLAREVVLRPGVQRRAPPTLTELQIDARWGGIAGSINITGKESDGATLAITGAAAPIDSRP